MDVYNSEPPLGNALTAAAFVERARRSNSPLGITSNMSAEDRRDFEFERDVRLLCRTPAMMICLMRSIGADRSIQTLIEDITAEFASLVVDA
jgi:hypothetical protein